MDSFPDSSEDVLNDLDPLSRALLDLSIQRGMDDAEIAQVLGTDEESVFEVRVGLLRNLAEKVAPEHAQAELPELQAAVAERLYPGEEPGAEADDLGDEVDEVESEETPAEMEAETEPAAAEAEAEAEAEADTEREAEAEPEPEPDREPEPVAAPTPAARPSTSRRRSWLPIVLPILLVLAVVALIIAVGSGDDGDEQAAQPAAEPQRTQPSTPDTPAESEEPKPTRLTALGSGDATGTATVDDDRLTMTLRGLPDANGGTYTVWLYNSVIDAEQIGTVKNGKVDAKLPKGADKYEFLDVSVEPKDGNPNHSGQSVLRVSLNKLRAAG